MKVAVELVKLSTHYATNGEVITCIQVLLNCLCSSIDIVGNH